MESPTDCSWDRSQHTGTAMNDDHTPCPLDGDEMSSESLPGEHEKTVSIEAPVRPSQADVVAEGLPEAIGPYRILGKLGEGGLGIVYEAEQRQPRRRVALKVMRGGPFIDEDRARMLQREAETLARLKHPHIGSIYEAGRTAEGQHFFAMELIRGDTLDDWLRARPDRLDAEEERVRLRVFRKIVDAVHYAHQRGVIHRDLKPSNIIVSDELSGSGSTSSLSPVPEVKILDFGLARITDQDVAAASVLTEIGVIKGTLPYMSPEQARGNPDEIDVRTDVYALGIILYEMLSGRRPYDVARSALGEALRVICEEAPRPLRETWSGVHRLSRDVETIVGKALEKDAERRYGSAAALSEDVERFLSSQPILARPPSAGYQLRMMVARHRAWFAAMVAVLVVVVGASVVSTVQYLRAEREAVRARTEAEKASQVASFLRSMLEGAGPAIARGRDASLLREILDQTSDRVREELAGQPEVEASIRSTLGTTYLELGDFEQAEVHLRAALAGFQALAPESADVATSLSTLGVLETRMGRYEEAERFYRQALEMRRQVLGTEHTETAQSLTSVGNALVDLGRNAEAEPYLREALALHRSLADGPDAALAISINSLGNLLHHQQAYDEAERLYREALAMHREALGDDHPDVVVDLNNLAYLLRNKGDLAGAEELFSEVLEANRRLYGESHPRVAESLANLAMVRYAATDYDGAEGLLREALAMQRVTLGEENPDVATTLQSLGNVYAERGEFATARSYYLQSLDMSRATLGEVHPRVVTLLTDVASMLMREERFAEAEATYDEALALSLGAFGERSPTTVELRNEMAQLLEKRGDLEGAETQFRAVLEVRRELLGDANPKTAVTSFYLGRVIEAQGRLDEAEEYFTASMEGYRGSFGPDHAATAFAEARVARFFHARGQYDHAERLLRHADEVLATTYGPLTPRGGSAAVLLARTLAANGKVEEAEEIFREASKAGAEAIGDGLFARVQVYEGELRANQGRFAEAESLLLAGHSYFEDKRRPDHPERREVSELVAALYESWHAADPTAGKGAQARHWRARLG